MNIDPAPYLPGRGFWGMSRLVNLTPHPITIARWLEEDPHDPQAGPGRYYEQIPPSGTVARVASQPGERVGSVRVGRLGCDIYTAAEMGTLEGLPDPEDGVTYIVSLIAAQAAAGRTDVVSPGTGPRDEAIREDGQLKAVTRLILAPRCGAKV